VFFFLKEPSKCCKTQKSIDFKNLSKGV